MKIFTRLSMLALCLLFSSAMKASVYVDGIAYDVTSDDEVAAMDCQNISNLVIPETAVLYGKTYRVTSIGQNGFQNNEALTAVTIPSSMTYIDPSAFGGCPNVKELTYANGCTKTIKTYLYSIEKVNIPNSVTTIGLETFCAFSALKSIDFPKSVTTLEGHAFWGCTGLTSIIIPSNIYDIATDAFDGCSNVKELTYVDGCTHTVRTGLSSIEKVNIPNSVTSIDDDAFWGCNFLSSVDIPYTVTSIGARAFRETALSSVNIPDGVTSIGGGAFQFCQSLTSVSIPISVTHIWDYAFQGCTNLPSIVIPNSVTQISDNAFNGCYNMQSVTIPSSVEQIGEDAFKDCPIEHLDIDNQKYCSNVAFGVQLKELVLGSSVTNIADEAFKGCAITSLNIPDGITNIGSAAFQFCSSLSSVSIPNSVKEIGGYAFDGCPIETLNIDNEKFCNKDVFGNMLKCVVLGNNVTSIGYGAFSQCFSLESVTVPESVQNIGQLAFYWCSSLQSFKIPEGITNIEMGTFSECRALASINIPESVNSIGDEAFLNCALTSIIIPDNVASIGNRTFAGCTKLEHVVNLSKIPQTITRDVFDMYSNLHVRPGFKQIYNNSDIWDKFNIIDDAYEFITGIETIKQDASLSKAYYSLGGVRSSNPTKGIYIVGGKKVLMK